MYCRLKTHVMLAIMRAYESSPSGHSVNVSGPLVSSPSSPSVNVSGTMVSSPSGPLVNVSGPLVSSPTGPSVNVLCIWSPGEQSLWSVCNWSSDESLWSSDEQSLCFECPLVLTNWFTSHFHLICLVICLLGTVLPYQIYQCN